VGANLPPEGQPDDTQMNQTLSYLAPVISSGHCRAITAEGGAIAGVESVTVDLDGKRVAVTGEALDYAAMRAAIYGAGYEAE
jgi:copper chaperone CopZ